MATASVFDVAALILKRSGSMTTMKLQKLVYYCQAWSLVWDEEPIFREEICAWANGPVVPRLFAYHRREFMIRSIHRRIGDPDNLSKDQVETVDAVLKFYGGKSAQWLSDLTHNEAPWRDARRGLGDDDRRSPVIALDSMREYYSIVEQAQG